MGAEEHRRGALGGRLWKGQSGKAEELGGEVVAGLHPARSTHVWGMWFLKPLSSQAQPRPVWTALPSVI
jgi:hypothetical protein